MVLWWFFDIDPSAPMTMGTVFALFFHILPISIAKSLYFSSFSSSFFTTLVSSGTATSMILHPSIILSIRIRSGLLASIVLPVYTLKSHNSLMCSFSITGSALWSYHFSVWGRPYFLHRAQCIVVATLSCRFFVFCLSYFWALTYNMADGFFFLFTQSARRYVGTYFYLCFSVICS